MKMGQRNTTVRILETRPAETVGRSFVRLCDRHRLDAECPGLSLAHWGIQKSTKERQLRATAIWEPAEGTTWAKLYHEGVTLVLEANVFSGRKAVPGRGGYAAVTSENGI